MAEYPNGGAPPTTSTTSVAGVPHPNTGSDLTPDLIGMGGLGLLLGLALITIKRLTKSAKG